MRHLLSIILIFISTQSFAAKAPAQKIMNDVVQDIKDHCGDDVTRYCAAIEPGEGRLINCLRDHQKELTTTCNVEVKKAQAMMKDMDGPLDL